MSVQINGISGYNEDQVVLVAHSSAKFVHHVPIILGTPTMDQVITTLKESKNRQVSHPMGMCKEKYFAFGQQPLRSQLLGLMSLQNPSMSWAMRNPYVS